MAKTTQLQIRVSPEDKRRLTVAATKAGVSVSEWVLSQALPRSHSRFWELAAELEEHPDRASFTLAALNDLLTGLPAAQLVSAVVQPPARLTSPLHRAYVAAMVEHACERTRKVPPEWTRKVEALSDPYFASSLVGLRAHLLRSSPPAFRRRNIFIDATLGDRV